MNVGNEVMMDDVVEDLEEENEPGRTGTTRGETPDIDVSGCSETSSEGPQTTGYPPNDMVDFG